MKGQEAVAEQPAAHLSMAVIWSNLGENAKAEDAYRTALRLDPRFIPARVNLAMLLDRLNRKAEAAEQFREVLKINPDFSEAHYSLGLLLAEDEAKLPEAAERLKHAAELMPQNARVWYNLGLACQKLKRYDEGANALKRSAKLSPDPTDRGVRLGSALLTARESHRRPGQCGVSCEASSGRRAIRRILRWNTQADRRRRQDARSIGIPGAIEERP